MNNFVFQNHTRIYFGKGVVEEYLAKLLQPYGKNVLLAYGGGSIKRTGVYDTVTAQVRAAGKTVFDFPGIMANPTKAKVDEGVRLVKEKNIDFILAVGGGSAIDCAKAIAIGSRYAGDWWNDFWLNQGRVDFEQLPLGVVLTISGTGSEFDGGGVITNTETNIKTGRIYPELSPNFSLLDPDYTLTVPERQVRATAFDTMSHLMEFYFCKPDTDNVSDDLLEALLRAQIRNFRSFMKDLKDYDARSNIEWISSLALCGIMGLGKQPDFDCHNLEHQIGAFTDCVHGEGLAVITPPYYRWLLPHAVGRFVRFAVNVWGLAPQGDDKALAAAGVEALADFIRSVGLPTTMQQLGVKDMAELTKIARSVQTGPGTYCKCTPADVEAIFKACWE
ncbi:MAG: iron-containing alcohol dehydrogenase [Desulfovibrio sp.]|uniref:iron-containing alcohol dehydrogenase n=1 Tax=Desulfovibrio sp. TaxID=885 RepID=UPI001A6FBFC6|nr:iron-containing alcohol dehydrogenase [Desulfovibrio sp.]MBD5418136.1 iron-containing alcohol dehydrogenase [Desulfovibrio sp.]